MAYVAVKGGEKAITNAHRWLAEDRRGDTAVPEIEVAQVREQLSLAIDRVMSEGSCYDRDLAALAVKQSRGVAEPPQMRNNGAGTPELRIRL